MISERKWGAVVAEVGKLTIDLPVLASAQVSGQLTLLVELLGAQLALVGLLTRVQTEVDS